MMPPPNTDKWIVFCAGLILGLLEFSFLLAPLPCVFAALMQAAAFFLVYVIWSLCWRLMARHAGQQVSRNVRIWTNTTFAALAVSFIPIPTHAVKIDLPEPVRSSF